METKYPSPNGDYLFQIFPWEARMSLWIESPHLIEVKTGQTILSFNDANWSLDNAQWLDNTTAKLWLRKYPGDHHPSCFEVTLNCRQKQAWLMGATPIAIEALEPALEALLS